jgi:hypothetical protein
MSWPLSCSVLRAAGSKPAATGTIAHMCLISTHTLTLWQWVHSSCYGCHKEHRHYCIFGLVFARKWSYALVGTESSGRFVPQGCYNSFFFSVALPAHSEPWRFIQFRNKFSQSVGLLGWVIRPSQGFYLNTWKHKQKINAYTHQTSVPWVGFKPTIPVSERAKTVPALHRAPTLTSCYNSWARLKQSGWCAGGTLVHSGTYGNVLMSSWLQVVSIRWHSNFSWPCSVSYSNRLLCAPVRPVFVTAFLQSRW